MKDRLIRRMRILRNSAAAITHEIAAAIRGSCAQGQMCNQTNVASDDRRILQGKHDAARIILRLGGLGRALGTNLRAQWRN